MQPYGIMTDKRRFGWPIQTYLGGRFYPLDPRADEIDVRDVAHALSLICRYGGHCLEFYSVAEHCCRVADYLLEHYGPMLAYHGLLHDGAEAYLLDVPRPLKKWWLFRLIYEHFEAKMEKALAQRFGLIYPWPRQVKEADNILLATERRDNMAPCEHEWAAMAQPLPGRIRPWDARYAEEEWLKRYKGLRALLQPQAQGWCPGGPEERSS